MSRDSRFSKKKVTKNAVLLAMTVFGLTSGAALRSFGVEGDDLSEEGFFEPIQMSVVGQVKFEKRYTRVLNSECISAPCESSQVYWTLVVQAGSNRYVLRDHPYNLGDLNAPEKIELKGIELRQGAVVQVEGQVVFVAPGYLELSGVQSVSVLME